MNIIQKFKQLKNRNWLRRMWGWGLTILGAVNAIDFESPFPIPLVGMAAITASILSFIAGAVLLYLVYRPQIDDALEIAPYTNGILSVLIVKNYLGVTLETAERTIKKLWDRGYLILVREPPSEEPKDEIAIEMEKKYGSDIVDMVDTFSMNQRELSRCLFKVPFSASEMPEKIEGNSKRQVIRDFPLEDVKRILRAIDDEVLPDFTSHSSNTETSDIETENDEKEPSSIKEHQKNYDIGDSTEKKDVPKKHMGQKDIEV